MKKDIVNKSQMILKDFGYNVNEDHLQKMYDILNDDSNWKDKEYRRAVLEREKKIIAELNSPPSPIKLDSNFHASSLKEYLNDLKSGKFNNVFNLGFREDTKKWSLKDFKSSPNALFVGKMGSGKSMACRFTLLTWMLANSHKTQLFIIDSLQGSTDYKEFFRKDTSNNNVYRQVNESLQSIEKTKKIIDLLWTEFEARQEFFRKTNTFSMDECENLTKMTMNRCLTLIENPVSLFEALNFEQECTTPLSSANKLWTLLKIGRSSGIWFLFDERNTVKIPTQVISSFSNRLAFKMSILESAYSIGTEDAVFIESKDKGQCLNEYHKSIQFPLISDEDMSELLKIYMKHQTGYFAYLTPAIIKDALKD